MRTDPSQARRRTVPAALTALAGLAGLIAAPALLTGSAADAAGAPAASRTAYPPNVMYPVARGTSGVTDRRLYGVRGYPATQIQAPCGARVVASHTGTVAVGAESRGYSYVWVTSSVGRSQTIYTVAGRGSVTSGQIVSPGQQLGTVPQMGGAAGCETLFAVRSQWGTRLNPTTWLDLLVGKPMLESTVFGNRGFNLASFNVLGASHTDSGGSSYASSSVRMPKAVAMLKAKAVDVAGLQELQHKQHQQLLALAGATYAAYPADQVGDTENAIIWRRSAFSLVSAGRIAVPYFDGHTRMMPVVHLRDLGSGRDAYFINVHNPANTAQFHNQEKYRAAAIAVERAAVVRLRATGLAVFLTGDLNDRTGAFCPLTAGKLMLSAQSVPSTSCAPPPSPWIDWVLAAGPARFTTYTRDWSAKTQGITDHPIVVSHAHLAPYA